MRKRPLAILLLSVTLAGVMALCGLTAFGTYRYAQANRFVLRRDETAQAEVIETQTYAVAENLELEIDTALGDIRVEAGGQAGQVVAEITRRGWGETRAEAEQEAQSVQVEVTEAPGRLSLRYTAPEKMQVVMGIDHSNTASFTLTVPANVSVRLVTGNGSILLSGTHGGAELENAFGDVTVTDVIGVLAVNTSASGTVILRNVETGGQPVTLTAGFGEVTLEDLTAGDVTLQSGNGPTRLLRVRSAGQISLSSSFGQMELQDVTARELSITNESGGVEINGAEISGPASVSTHFSNLTLSDVNAASLTLSNQGGPVRVDGASGPLEVRGSFGEVEITGGEDVALTVDMDQGTVSFSGSLDPQAEHRIETAFGDVTLSLPADSRLDLDLETNQGSIHSEIPVTLAGELSASNWTGKLNGGGAALTIRTQGGNIDLKILPGD